MTFKRTLLFALMFLGLAACGPDGGQSSVDDAACSPVDAGPAVSPFVGAWQPTAGTTTCTCNDGSTLTTPVDQTDLSTITAGCAFDQISIMDNSTGCSETCAVSGTTASCHPTTCTVPGVGVTLKTTSDVYTLSDGQLHETGSGTEIFSNGITCQCATTDDAYDRAP